MNKWRSYLSIDRDDLLALSQNPDNGVGDPKDNEVASELGVLGVECGVLLAALDASHQQVIDDEKEEANADQVPVTIFLSLASAQWQHTSSHCT